MKFLLNFLSCCDAKVKPTTQTDMNNASDAKNMVTFFDAANNMITGLTEVGADIPTVVNMAFCVLGVHPSHWTVFGDAPTFVRHNCKKMVCEFLGPLKVMPTVFQQDGQVEKRQ